MLFQLNPWAEVLMGQIFHSLALRKATQRVKRWHFHAALFIRMQTHSLSYQLQEKQVVGLPGNHS